MPQSYCSECNGEFMQFKTFQKMCSSCYSMYCKNGFFRDKHFVHERDTCFAHSCKLFSFEYFFSFMFMSIEAKKALKHAVSIDSKTPAAGAVAAAATAKASAAASAAGKQCNAVCNKCQHMFYQYDAEHLMCQPCYRSFKFEQQKARDAKYALEQKQKAIKLPETTCDVCTKVFTPHFQCRVCYECATAWRGANAQPCHYKSNFVRCERSALPPYPKSKEWMDEYINPEAAYCGRTAEEHNYATRLPQKGEL